MALETQEQVSGQPKGTTSLKKRITSALMSIVLAWSALTASTANESVHSVDSLADAVAHLFGVSPSKALELVTSSGITQATRIIEISNQQNAKTGALSISVTTRNWTIIIDKPVA